MTIIAIFHDLALPATQHLLLVPLCIKHYTQLCIHTCMLLCWLGSVSTDCSNMDHIFSFFPPCVCIHLQSIFPILRFGYWPFFINNPFHTFCTVSRYWCTGICDLYRRDRPNLSCILRDFFHHHEAKSFDGFVCNTSMDRRVKRSEKTF